MNVTDCSPKHMSPKVKMGRGNVKTTVRDQMGSIYLFIKKTGSPLMSENLCQRVKLSRFYNKAKDQINGVLHSYPKYLIARTILRYRQLRRDQQRSKNFNELVGEDDDEEGSSDSGKLEDIKMNGDFDESESESDFEFSYDADDEDGAGDHVTNPKKKFKKRGQLQRATLQQMFNMSWKPIKKFYVAHPQTCNVIFAPPPTFE